MNIAVLSDPLTWTLAGAGALVFLALFGYLALTYARLPASLPIHFNALGQADRITDKAALFNLLKIDGGLLLGNILAGCIIYYREKTAAYLLWGSSVVANLLLWTAVLTIT